MQIRNTDRRVTLYFGTVREWEKRNRTYSMLDDESKLKELNEFEFFNGIEDLKLKPA